MRKLDVFRVIYVTPKFLLLFTVFVLAPVSSLFSTTNKTDLRTAAIPNREIHDEPEADNLADCIALGELDVIFRSENDGTPRVGVLLTDPRGRRIGFDPLTKNSWDELPMAQGYIDCDSSFADGRCRGIVQVCGPVSGAYKLEVIGRNPSIYSIAISARSKRTRVNNAFQNSLSEADITRVPARNGSRDIFLLNYSREVDTKISVQMPMLKAKHSPVRLREPGTLDRQASRVGATTDRPHTAAN